jgi:hypothetical protein
MPGRKPGIAGESRRVGAGFAFAAWGRSGCVPTAAPQTHLTWHKQNGDPRSDLKAAVFGYCTMLRYRFSGCTSTEPTSHMVPSVSGRG